MLREDMENIEFGKANVVGTTPKHAWRTKAPEVDTERCVVCGICVDTCPEGCIEPSGEYVTVDLTFCKGCGICETECPPEAISMITEENR